jgi:hypothetical protein
MMAGSERGKGQIMLSEEWLRVLQAEREREIEAAQRAHEARSATSHPGRIRAWLDGHLAADRGSSDVRAATPQLPPCPQPGRAATDPSA